MSLFDELKRRRVFRAAAVYLVAAWAIIQVSDVVAPRIGLPDWTVTFVIFAAAIGLPIALIFAWLYDLNPDPRQSSSRPVDRRAIAFLGIGILIALAGFAALAGINRDNDSSAPPATDNGASIAVLPFVNMSADREQEYFSDGLTEELLNALSQVSTLRVAARTSSFSFKGKSLPVAEIARVLNVRTVLEGSVRKSGNRVRITAQLINAADGYHLWSDTYDRELTDIFAIQEEISRSITDALKLKLVASDSASLHRQERNLSAYDLYLRARFLWNQRTESKLREARELLERAIQIDPSFARAHAALADVYAVWNDYAGKVDRGTLAKSMTHARRALELDSTMAEAVAALANNHYRNRRWREAEAEFKRAIAMKPGYATARQWYAWMLLYSGRPNEAIAEIDAGIAADPLNLIVNENKGEHLMFAGRYNEAIEQFKRVLAMDSTFTVTYPYIALAYSLSGDHTNAVRWADRTLARGEGGVYDLGQSAFVLARAGRTGRARDVLEEMERRGFWAMSASAYLTLGDTARALDNLEREYAAEGHESLYEQLTFSPGTVGIRNHPRVKELRRKLGMKP